MLSLALNYPTIEFNTNACGELHTGDAPRGILAAVPFQDGPGYVLPYLTTINDRFYVLGNLEVAFSDEKFWGRDAEDLPDEELVMSECTQAVLAMRERASGSMIVFPVDFDPMPARCVISVAIPVQDGQTQREIKDQLSLVFSGYEQLDDRLMKLVRARSH
ncbi:hypothetical protein SGO26_30110 (plasmid) [Cupriavidus metallidurans]|uniref:hypothetical protein n=1 Tax=Cupriavidus metallidurans TaxID=119219 RepID=UPI003D70D624